MNENKKLTFHVWLLYQHQSGRLVSYNFVRKHDVNVPFKYFVNKTSIYIQTWYPDNYMAMVFLTRNILCRLYLTLPQLLLKALLQTEP